MQSHIVEEMQRACGALVSGLATTLDYSARKVYSMQKTQACYSASIAAGFAAHSARCVEVGEVYPSVIIHQAAPVPHLHHGLEAEDGLLVEAAALWDGEGTCC